MNVTSDEVNKSGFFYQISNVLLGTSFFFASLLVYFSPQLSEKISFYLDKKNQTQEILGKISAPDYSCSLRKYGERSFYPCKQETFHHLDTIKVSNGTQVEIFLTNGYTLKINGPALFIGELWWSKDNKSPVVLHMVTGDFFMTAEGPPGQLYVIKNGILKDAKGAFLDQNRIISLPIVRGNTSIKTTRSPSSRIPIASQTDQMPLSKGTLSNEYLDQRISQEQESFQRCHSNAIRNQIDVKGEYLVGITISPEGKVTEAQILSSTLENPSLQSCVLQVFRRITFNRFEGANIVRSFPLRFESL